MNKDRDVKKAGPKKVSTSINKMGQPEDTTKHNSRTVRVLNELDPSEFPNPGDEDMPKQVQEAVQDHRGVSGDYMEKMGGKTDRLGSKIKNKGGSFEEFGQSKTGSPEDGITTHLRSGDLGGKVKNSGGTFEEMGDSKHGDACDGISDCMDGKGSDLGQNAKIKNKGAAIEPMKGSKNSMSEDWSIDNVASLMEDADVNLQELFDNYARQANYVCLDDFSDICRTVGIGIIPESTFISLLANNKEYLFAESMDAAGRFWVPAVSEEWQKPWLKDKDDSDDNSDEELDEEDEGLEECGESCVDEEDECMEEENEEIEESVGQAGLAGSAPPLQNSMSAGVAGQRRKHAKDGPQKDKEEDLVAVANSDQIEESCSICGSFVDSYGCPRCQLNEEGLGVGAFTAMPSGKGADKTKSGLGAVDKKQKKTKEQDSKPGKAEDGITSEMGGRCSQLGQNDKIKNKGGTFEPLKGGSKSMQENVLRLARSAKKYIEEAAKSIGRVGKYSLRFGVQCEGVEPRSYLALTEAVVDTEELIQAYGPKSVNLNVIFNRPNGDRLLSKRIPLPTLARRDPVVSEGKVLFRFAEVANDFADQVVNEGVACRVASHNWGAAVAGRFNWKTATKAFSSIIGESRQRKLDEGATWSGTGEHTGGEAFLRDNWLEPANDKEEALRDREVFSKFKNEILHASRVPDWFVSHAKAKRGGRADPMVIKHDWNNWRESAFSRMKRVLATNVRKFGHSVALEGLERGSNQIDEAFGVQVRSPEEETDWLDPEANTYDYNKRHQDEPEYDVNQVDDGLNTDVQGDAGEEEGEDDYIPGGGYNPEAPGAYDPEGQVCPECGGAEAPIQGRDTDWACPSCGYPRSGSEEAEYGSFTPEAEQEVDDWDEIEVNDLNRIRDQEYGEHYLDEV